MKSDELSEKIDSSSRIWVSKRTKLYRTTIMKLHQSSTWKWGTRKVYTEIVKLKNRPGSATEDLCSSHYHNFCLTHHQSTVSCCPSQRFKLFIFFGRILRFFDRENWRESSLVSKRILFCSHGNAIGVVSFPPRCVDVGNLGIFYFSWENK